MSKEETNANAILTTTEEEISESELNKQSRRFILTINNPTETDEEMDLYLKSVEHIKYFIFQREKGHECETEHFQMYLVFSIGKRFSTLKKLFPRAHFEACKGTNVQCRDYCSKSDTRVSGPYEYGEFAEQRSRTDLKSFLELIKTGATNELLLELYPMMYVKYRNLIQTIRQDSLKNDLKNKIKEDFTCIYIYGSSGVGKTRSLFEKYGNSGAFFVSDYESHPFDEYENQDVMVFDEYRSQFNLSIFLKLSDIYPVTLSCRYNNKVGNYTKLFVLSNIPMEAQYKWQKTNDYASYKGFPRRFHYVLRYTENKVFVEIAKKPIEKLKDLLPEKIYSMLDTSNTSNGDRNQIRMFKEIPTDELPF